LALFGAFAGFAVFCACYAFHVWFRRNPSQAGGSSLVTRVGMLTAAVGALGFAACWAQDRFVLRQGVVSGDGLFVVHARHDAEIRVNAEDRVRAGDVVAELHPPSRDAELAVYDRQIEEANARVEAVAARPLQLDPALLQEQAQLRAEVDQKGQSQLDLARARRDLEKFRLDVVSRLEAEQSKILSEIATDRTALDGLPPRIGVAQAGLGRADELHKRALISAETLDERTIATLGLQAESDRLKAALAGLESRLALVKEQMDHAAATYAEQIAAVEREADAERHSAEAFAAQMAVVDQRIEADRKRAELQRQSEVTVAKQQVSTLAAERGRALSAVQIRAPYDGRIVYRDASPGLAQEGAPILALSSGAGFEARVPMPAAEAAAVARASEVRFAVQRPVLEKYFSAKFRRADPDPFQPDYDVASFDAYLPDDVVAQLGDAHGPMAVYLLWHPQAMASRVDQALLGLAVLGVLLAAAGALWGDARPRKLRPIPAGVSSITLQVMEPEHGARTSVT
jgi:multidrug resistance efflux pump